MHHRQPRHRQSCRSRHRQAGILAEPRLEPAEIRERMSGNICRCGAYPNIVAAIQDAAS